MASTNNIRASDEYKFKRGLATPIIYLQLTKICNILLHYFLGQKITPVAELNVIPDATWFQPSMHRCHPHTMGDGFGAILLGGE